MRDCYDGMFFDGMYPIFGRLVVISAMVFLFCQLILMGIPVRAEPHVYFSTDFPAENSVQPASYAGSIAGSAIYQGLIISGATRLAKVPRPDLLSAPLFQDGQPHALRILD